MFEHFFIIFFEIFRTTKKSEPAKPAETNGKLENGVSASGEESENDGSDDAMTYRKSKKEIKKKQESRSKQRDKQKLKKEARELRAKAMSEGLESFDFSSVKLENGNAEDEPMENGDSQENIAKITKTSKKRTNHEIADTPNKTKKKKKNHDNKE